MPGHINCTAEAHSPIAHRLQVTNALKAMLLTNTGLKCSKNTSGLAVAQGIERVM